MALLEPVPVALDDGVDVREGEPVPVPVWLSELGKGVVGAHI